MKEDGKAVQVQMQVIGPTPPAAGSKPADSPPGPSAAPAGKEAVSEDVAYVKVKFNVLQDGQRGSKRRKNSTRLAEFLSLDKKDNGLIKLGDKAEFTIPLFYDELIFAGKVKLPTYGNLSIEDNLLQCDVDDEFVERLTQLLKKKRRKLDSVLGSKLGPSAAKGEKSQSRSKELYLPPPPMPPPDFNSPEIKAFIEENLKKVEEEMFHRGLKRVLRTEVPKHHRIINMFFRKQQNDAKKIADASLREMKARFFRVHKESIRSQQRTRRLVREMTLYWKKQEKGSAREKKIADREAAEARRKEEEEREAKRKEHQLNFLLTQTELYAHFMANKIGYEQPDPIKVQEAKFDGLTEAEQQQERDMHEQAKSIANGYVSQTERAKHTFDEESERLRLQSGSMQNPSTMPSFSTVSQPKGLDGELKGYQVKGLQWLVNIYDQGLNGILADEMGLGKTIQAISFLAHLAEEKNIWGPFLVVAPGSTLHNWDREIQSFYPKFKVLPYWGNKVQRRDIRPLIHPKKLYSSNSHHIVVTSYDIVLKDELQLKRIKWQYMILDEAQAIKNADSFRWKILLSFNCRNRLLLTGTPIQNNMAELWALLHFIMPTLFDSHDQFNEWFSRGIEGHAEGTGALNEHQLKRLHTVLQPFMLRRVKKDVENDMAPKKEVIVPCYLTKRQNELYRRIKEKISIVDLFDGKSMNEGKVLNLMNIVVQLRKVCNHPQLFEQQKETIPFHFADVNMPLQPAPWGELDWAWWSGTSAAIKLHLPRLIYNGGMECLSTRFGGHLGRSNEKWTNTLLDVLEPSNVHCSIFEHTGRISAGISFLRLIGLTPSSIKLFSNMDGFQKWYFSRRLHQKWNRVSTFLEDFSGDSLSQKSSASFLASMLVMKDRLPSSFYQKHWPVLDPTDPPLVMNWRERVFRNGNMLKTVGRYIERVRALPVEVYCPHPGFANQRKSYRQSDWEHQLLYGFRNHQVKHWVPDSMPREEEMLVPYSKPLISPSVRLCGSGLPVKFYALAKALADGGKFQVLDKLLQKLKAEGRRALMFCQMTQMMNLIEDYMVFRKFKFLRLDGSTKLEDRRDMVDAFQTQDDIFLFLLSTRAGGLGINLTAADTVIFYESDWNPTMDQQAMDRAHRLGQTKEVTVYRLICHKTIEEKILQRASQKNVVQRLVMKTGDSKADIFDSEEVVSLLLDDSEMEQKLKSQAASAAELKDQRQDNSKRKKALVKLESDGAALVESSDVHRTESMNNKSQSFGGEDAERPEGARNNGSDHTFTGNGIEANDKHSSMNSAIHSFGGVRKRKPSWKRGHNATLSSNRARR